MNGIWWETLENWKKHQGSDEQQANVYILLLLRQTLEKFGSADASSLDRFRYRLELSIDDKQPEDWASYNLGMVKALNYFLQFQTTEKMKDYTIGALTPLEKKVIIQLTHAPKSMPTDISKNLKITRQQISNLLRSLRAKQLVDFTEVGKNRIYVLTADGNRAYEQFRSIDESSASVLDNKQLKWAVENNLKKKAEDYIPGLKRVEKDLTKSLNYIGVQTQSQENEDKYGWEAYPRHSKSGESHPKNRIAPYLLTKDREGEGALQR